MRLVHRGREEGGGGKANGPMINGHINAGTLFKESHRASRDPVDHFDSEAMHCLSYTFGVRQMVNHQLVY